MMTVGIERDDIHAVGDEFGDDFFRLELGPSIPEAIGRQIKGVAFIGRCTARADADCRCAAGEDDATDASGLGRVLADCASRRH